MLYNTTSFDFMEIRLIYCKTNLFLFCDRIEEKVLKLFLFRFFWLKPDVAFKRVNKFISIALAGFFEAFQQ